ncbi:MAG TPA: hypothetical protein PKY82_29230 [Pyrinomonadaceae bacterium]|nr:hypothetical protein [Pyrinomonadaceae bacterium]
MTTFPKARTKNLVVQELEKELLIYDLSINKAFCLNESLALIWKHVDGKNSVADISILLSRKLKTLVTEEFVWLGLDQLKKDNLLENSSEIATNFSGLNRRQVIKNIGFASMIALPLISSVIAPTSATAASCSLFAPGTFNTTGCFTSPSDCNVNFGPQCCSGAANNIASPCPLLPAINACACV